jgi:alkylation response protein AidB-like acyl-CoA dehydrogenase
MNFDLTDEQKLFADQVRRFAQIHLAAGALKRAHDPRFPYRVAQLMANWYVRSAPASRSRKP